MKFLNFYHFLNILSEAYAIYVKYSCMIAPYFYRYCSSLLFLCGCRQLGISGINYCLCLNIEYLSHIFCMLKEQPAIPNWMTPAAMMHSIFLGLHRKTNRLSSALLRGSIKTIPYAARHPVLVSLDEGLCFHSVQ